LTLSGFRDVATVAHRGGRHNSDGHSETTRLNYRATLDRVLIPRFGAVKIAAIRAVTPLDAGHQRHQGIS
jgi:hypothetical protein